MFHSPVMRAIAHNLLIGSSDTERASGLNQILRPHGSEI